MKKNLIGWDNITRKIDTSLNTYTPYSTPPSFISTFRPGEGRSELLNYLMISLDKRGFPFSSPDRTPLRIDLSDLSSFSITLAGISHPYSNSHSRVFGVIIQNCKSFLDHPDHQKCLLQLNDLSKTSSLVFFLGRPTINTVKRFPELIECIEHYTNAQKLEDIYYDKELLVEIGIAIWKRNNRRVKDSAEFREALTEIFKRDHISTPKEVDFFLDMINRKFSPEVLTTRELFFIAPELSIKEVKKNALD